MPGIKKKYVLTILLLSIPVLTTFLPESVKEPFRLRTARIFQAPLTKTNNFFYRLRETFSPKGFFSRRLKPLNAQIQALKTENSQVKELLLENKRLNDLLSFKQNIPFRAIPAKIIAKDPSNWRNTVLINKGNRDGVKKNMFLTTKEGLAGRICETGNFVSKAVLLTDPEFKVAAICQRSREQMIVTGTGRRLCAMRYLSENADLQKKDSIVTSGIGGFCQKGILIGEVTAVSESPYTIMIKAFLEPSAHLHRLEEILVLTEGENSR